MPEEKEPWNLMEKDFLSSDGKEQEEDRFLDPAFRPTRLGDFVGNASLKENLMVYISASKKRGEALDHVLFHGPPGLGKTTLAHIIASEMEVQIQSVQAPALEKTGDMAAHLTRLGNGDIFFIDEIHRMKIAIEELLYSAMEDFKLDIVLGQGAGARCVRIPLSRFTLVGATTNAGLLSSPFYSRFGIVERLDFYDQTFLKELVFRTASLMGLKIEEESAWEIAKRSRGTPRVVNRIMRRLRDFLEMSEEESITLGLTKKALEKLGIDAEGLDASDRKFLKIMWENYQGGPVGLETLAVSMSESASTLEDINEPFLIQKGFLQRTQRGRKLTPYAYQYLGLSGKKEEQGRLF